MNIRIGHPARILEDLESYSIYAQLEKEVERLGLANFWDRIKKKIVERDKFEKPIPSLRRDLTDEEIIRLAKEKRGLRGLSRELIQSMARWIELNREISRAISTYKAKEAEIIKNLIGLAEVVLSTNSMVASEFLQGFEFDIAVIDEGSQQIEPSTLIPILRAKRFIIAGDHKQLPPVIQSEKAKELEQTLFERLIRDYPSLSAMLIVQYRMHEVLWLTQRNTSQAEQPPLKTQWRLSLP
jgi:superfamily I DNA and/or RNA helicase